MRKILILIFVLVGIFFSALSCSEKGPKTVELVSNVSIPAQMTVQMGDEVKIEGEGFMMGDIIVFKAYKTVEFEVKEVGSSYATILISKAIIQGKYDVELHRDSEIQKLGSTTITIGTKEDGENNVLGKVIANGAPLAGVRVSDGKVWATTDEKGEYALKSDKTRGLVFVVIPSGYFPEVVKGFPQFWKSFSSQDVTVSENIDFFLDSVSNDNHKMIFSADWHIAGRLNDLHLLKTTYQAETNALGNGGATPIYEIALGDITWDSFWANGKQTPAVWKNLNASSPHPIFTLMGNHDYNMTVYGTKDNDLAASKEYREALGPAYYSMNIGKVHYVVIDNILYDNSNGTAAGRNSKETVSEENIAWIKEDLKGLDKNTPIVVAAHAPFYRINPSNGSWKMAAVVDNASKVLALFSDFQDVRIFCGHQHVHQYKDYNAAGQSFAKNTMIEYTVPPIGGTLWTTESYSGYDICTDGCPPAYDVLNVKGSKMEVSLKAIGKDENHQMRIYDMNKVKDFWDADSGVKSLVAYNASYGFAKLFGNFEANSVLINVFFGDPNCKNMKIEVSEDGKTLSAQNVTVNDPQHVVAYEVPYYAKEKNINSSYKSVVSSHMFLVKTSSANSTITVKLTDANGKVYTETMTRPKAFN